MSTRTQCFETELFQSISEPGFCFEVDIGLLRWLRRSYEGKSQLGVCASYYAIYDFFTLKRGVRGDA